MLANLKTHASYFDPLQFINLEILKLLQMCVDHFSDVNAGIALKLSFSSCLMFCYFLMMLALHKNRHVLHADSYMLAFLPPPSLILNPQ